MAIIRNPLIVFNGEEQEIEYDGYITFLDKNGKLLYQYTITNFVNASMPNAPIDDVAGEGKWNIPTKDAIIEYFNRYNKVVVGPTYNICESTNETNDALIYRIKLLNDKSTISIPFSFSIVSGYMGIEWGDGNSQLFNNSQTSVTHTYENSGDYIIKIQRIGNPSNAIYSLGDLSGALDSATKLFQQSLYEVNVGKFTGRTQYLNTSLQNNAFYECSNLKCITLPDNVKEIGESCFYNTNIKNIFINATLDKDLYQYESINIFNIGAFQNCFSLCNVSAYSNNKNIVEIKQNVFSNCYKLQNFFSPNFNSNGKINAMSFEYCYSLRDFCVPQNLSFIYAYAFSNCINLKYLYIGNNIVNITTSAFDITNDTFGIFINPDNYIGFQNVTTNIYGATTLNVGNTFPNSAGGVPIKNDKWYETIEDAIYDRNFMMTGSAIPETKEYYCKLQNRTQPSNES